jgi:hypothetical protein
VNLDKVTYYTELIQDIKVVVLDSENVHEEDDQHHSPEHEHSLPCVGHKVLIEDGNGGQDQLRSREIDRESDGPVSNQCQPPGNPTRERRISLRCQHCRPVIYTTSGRVHGAYFSERSRNGERDERYENPTPEHRDRLAIGERDGEGRAKSEGYGHNGKRSMRTMRIWSMPARESMDREYLQSKDTHHAQRSWQFRLVAHIGQGRVGTWLLSFGHDGGWLRNRSIGQVKGVELIIIYTDSVHGMLSFTPVSVMRVQVVGVERGRRSSLVEKCKRGSLHLTPVEAVNAS